MTAELLKILEETESKVTFAIVVETLSERCDNWDLVIPTIIRKADKMGWMKAPDKDFGDKFTENLAELVATKAKKASKDAPPASTCPPTSSCPTDPNVRQRVTVGECVGSGLVGSIGWDFEPTPRPAMELLPMPHRDAKVLPMPGAPELLPMPHTPEQPILFDFGFVWKLR
jgi:hypothetical protein